MQVHIKKTIKFSPFGQQLEFSVAQSAFSSFQIDLGSQILLRTLKEFRCQKFADLGCGYGTLGISLLTQNPKSKAVFVDRDKVSLELTRINLEKNNLSGICLAGLGFDDLEENDFDLIMSNIPAKAGEKTITSFLFDGKFFLKDGGMMAVVVISKIADFVATLLKNNPEVEIVFEKSNAHYTVFHYHFLGQNKESYKPRFAKEIYFRDIKQFQTGNCNYRLQTAWGLSEFDKPDEDTRLLFENFNTISKKCFFGRDVLVVNSGIGHVPIALMKTKRGNLFLDDRDLLAEKMTNYNLQLNGLSPGQVWGGQKFDLAVVKLDPNDSRETQVDLVKRYLKVKKEEGALILMGDASRIYQLEKILGISRSKIQFKTSGHKIACYI